MFRLTTAFLLCLSALPALAAETPVKIATTTWGGSGVLFVAKEKNYYGDTKVDIKIIDDTAALVTAFRAGTLDMFSTTPDNVALLAASGIKGKIFYMTDYSEGADGIISLPEIKSLKDLKGKKVGFTRAFVSQYLLSKALAKVGLKMSDIQQVPFDDPSLAAQAMLSGKVDAAVSWQPFLTKVIDEKKGNVLVTSKDFGDLIPGEFMVSDKMLAEHPEEVKAIIKAWMLAYKDVKKDPKGSSEIFAKGFGTKPEEMLDAMKGIHFADSSLNAKHLCGDSPRSAELYDDAGNFWISEKIISKKGLEGKTAISSIGCELFKAK